MVFPLFESLYVYTMIYYRKINMVKYGYYYDN